MTGLQGLLGFQRALQRVLVLAGKIHHLRDFILGNLEGINAANPHPTLVNVKHDGGRFFDGFPKKLLQHMNHKLHRRIIVVEHQDFIQGGFFGFEACPGRQANATTPIILVVIVPVFIAHLSLSLVCLHAHVSLSLIYLTLSWGALTVYLRGYGATLKATLYVSTIHLGRLGVIAKG